MKQDYECCILNYVHSGKVLRYNQYAIRSKYNPKDAEGAMGGIGHRDAASDRESTRIFEAKYDPYISYAPRRTRTTAPRSCSNPMRRACMSSTPSTPRPTRWRRWWERW
jgi:hypothetical protein